TRARSIQRPASAVISAPLPAARPRKNTNAQCSISSGTEQFAFYGALTRLLRTCGDAIAEPDYRRRRIPSRERSAGRLGRGWLRHRRHLVRRVSGSEMRQARREGPIGRLELVGSGGALPPSSDDPNLIELGRYWSDVPMIESISAITLATHDMTRAVHFYRAIGFELLHGGEDASFTSFRVGKGYLNLISQPADRHWSWWGRAIFYV